jgi:hypothetical protein
MVPPLPPPTWCPQAWPCSPSYPRLAPAHAAFVESTSATKRVTRLDRAHVGFDHNRGHKSKSPASTPCRPHPKWRLCACGITHHGIERPEEDHLHTLPLFTVRIWEYRVRISMASVSDLAPLAMSQKKDDLLKHLNMDPETYALMAVSCALGHFRYHTGVLGLVKL